MDKRTILFVLSLTLTLFVVNLFFEQQSSDDVRKWQEQQLVKKEDKLKALKADIEKRTVSVDSLPIASLSQDAEGKNIIGYAVKSDDAYITFSWDNKLPKEVYAAVGKEKPVAVSLAHDVSSRGKPVVFRQSSEANVKAGTLPEFGRYEVQLVVMGAAGPAVFLGDYTDGHVVIPVQKAAELENEIVSQKGGTEKSVQMPSIPQALVLMKSDGQYVPAGVYNSDIRMLEPLDTFPSLKGLTAKNRTANAVVGPAGQQGEQYYVLETPYQQLVFSNIGAALAEINLPFKSKEDEESVVKEIEFDRDMVEHHPYNAHFPAHPYFTPGEGGQLVEHPQGELGGYYPLLRRDLIEKDRRNSVRIQPRFYALNIVSEYPETAELPFTVKSFEKDKIVFESVQGHRRITKTYSVSSDTQAPYAIDLTIDIEGDSRGLWLTSGVPEVEWISGAPAPALKYRITRNKQPVVESIDLPKGPVTVTSSNIDWVCNSNGFLGMILDPLGHSDSGYRAIEVPGNVVPSRLVEVDQEYGRFKADEMPGYMLLLPLKGTGGSMQFRIFAGPFATSVLETVDKTYSNPATGYNPDYIACQSFHGWFAFISEPFAKFLFILMNFFHSITGSWAFSIILLTVALRIMLYPLNAWSTKSMVKMQQIAPEVTAIQEKYKKDPKKAQLEIMNLYRDKGVNPVSGCFPLLIQMPFLIGMFDLLKSTFELRGASFIPGWIDNLTAPDVLFSWNMHIPFIGNQFHLLPILLGIVMYLQQTLMSTLPKDKSLWTEQQRQQRFMGNMMAIVFTVLFYNFPSGLNIYWLSSMLLGMAQQWWTTKRMNAAAAKVEVLPAKSKKKA